MKFFLAVLDKRANNSAMLRTAIRTGLIYSLLFTLISATAMMGMNGNAMSDRQAGVISGGAGMSAEAMKKASAPDETGRLPSNMAGAMKACCACDFGQGCSVEKPQNSYAWRFTVTGAARYVSLASQPPDAPPRT